MQNRIDQFGYVATLIGFIVDIITIAGLIVGLNQGGEIGGWLSKTVMPWLALSIWGLAVFTYIAMIEAFRKKYYPEIGNLHSFFKNNLFLEFKHPFLLLPAMISIIAYFWIIAYLPWVTDDKGVSIPIWAIIFSIMFFIVLVGIFGEMLTSTKHSVVEENWEEISKTIEIHLKNSWVIHSSSVKTSLIWLKISSEDAKYAMALYASKHPGKAIYADYQFKTDSDNSDIEDDKWRIGTGLINLQTVPESVLF